LVADRGLVDDTEELVLLHDRSLGLRAVVAIDDTTLGPGLGGVRWMSYPSEGAAIAEARRLARVMTLKNACADLPYGGAKSVILKEPTPIDRTAALRAFGRVVHQLDGAYLPGVDMGTSVEDLAVIATVAPNVSCDHEDPSPATALGVFAGIEAAVEHVDGSGLREKSVVVLGVGHVGRVLAEHLSRAGAAVITADIDEARARLVACSVGGTTVAVADALGTVCDVLAPCAGARVVDEITVGRLGCRILAGAANDVLTRRAHAADLAERGIAYVPDFLINAGGVIQIHARRCRTDEATLRRAVLTIGDRVSGVLVAAAETGRTPVEVAEEIASIKLGRAITLAA
jgi:leucine dehydrogenase